MTEAVKQSEIANYLTTLIEEKGRSVHADLNVPGHIGLTYQHLIEFIDQNIGEADQTAIRTKLVAIDFHNGDVFHFLDHLIQGMLVASGLETA